MTAENQLIEIRSGETRTVRVNCTLPNGGPVSLDGGVPTLYVARYLHAPLSEMLLIKTGTVDTYVKGGVEFWRANFNLVTADTGNIDPRQYVHQVIVRISAQGTVWPVAEGPFIVKPSLGD